jgi:hypothetical protein
VENEDKALIGKAVYLGLFERYNHLTSFCKLGEVVL